MLPRLSRKINISIYFFRWFQIRVWITPLRKKKAQAASRNIKKLNLICRKKNSTSWSPSFETFSFRRSQGCCSSDQKRGRESSPTLFHAQTTIKEINERYLRVESAEKKLGEGPPDLVPISSKSQIKWTAASMFFLVAWFVSPCTWSAPALLLLWELLWFPYFLLLFIRSTPRIPLIRPRKLPLCSSCSNRRAIRRKNGD